MITVTFKSKNKSIAFTSDTYKNCHRLFLDSSSDVKDHPVKVVIKSGYYIIGLPYKKFLNMKCIKGGLNE